MNAKEMKARMTDEEWKAYQARNSYNLKNFLPLEYEENEHEWVFLSVKMAREELQKLYGDAEDKLG